MMVYRIYFVWFPLQKRHQTSNASHRVRSTNVLVQNIVLFGTDGSSHQMINLNSEVVEQYYNS